MQQIAKPPKPNPDGTPPVSRRALLGVSAGTGFVAAAALWGSAWHEPADFCAEAIPSATEGSTVGQRTWPRTSAARVIDGDTGAWCQQPNGTLTMITTVALSAPQSPVREAVCLSCHRLRGTTRTIGR
jgi:hypothetical protein